MNSNALLNRMQILLYSTLTSAMSGLGNIRAHFQHQIEIPTSLSTDIAFEPCQPVVPAKEYTPPISWNSVSEVLLPILLWISLGFAAGFMLGLINPR